MCIPPNPILPTTLDLRLDEWLTFTVDNLPADWNDVVSSAGSDAGSSCVLYQ